MNPNSETKVAVVGARGIGRFHANWWRVEGAHVCAFVGTTAESVAKTREMLHESYGIEAKGYTDCDEMLEEEKPHIVDVCSPPPFHYAHVRKALDAGSHVLCEKPFVYDSALPHDALREQAQELVHLASRNSLLLGLCTQYSLGAYMFRELFYNARGVEPIRLYLGHLETPAKGRPADPERTWVDLSPHALSVLQELAPMGRLVEDTIRTQFHGYEATAQFEIINALGRRVFCEVCGKNTTQEPANVRRFEINGFSMAVDAQRDAEGQFSAKIISSDEEVEYPDMMRLLIREFLVGRCVSGGETALANLDWMLRILAKSREHVRSA